MTTEILLAEEAADPIQYMMDSLLETNHTVVKPVPNYSIVFDCNIEKREPGFGSGRYRIEAGGKFFLKNPDFKKLGKIDHYTAGYNTVWDALEVINSKINGAGKNPSFYSIEFKTDYLGLVFLLTGRSQTSTHLQKADNNKTLEKLWQFKSHKVSFMKTEDVVAVLGKRSK